MCSCKGQDTVNEGWGLVPELKLSGFDVAPSPAMRAPGPSSKTPWIGIALLVVGVLLLLRGGS